MDILELIKSWESSKLEFKKEIRLWQSIGNLKYDNILLQDSNINEIDITDFWNIE